MSKAVKKANFWVRRRSHLPILVIGSLMVMLLLFNDDASISMNLEYDRQIDELSAEIAECRDSAAFYRRQRESIIHGTAGLERLAREKFHMQKPSEDVFLLK
ncbi:MAG: hypothetical protein K2F94_06080 [Muribaculaceae bacterium]|nr:hypothetical protein [Muribaculaceae bacterium]MDE6399685.1 hypothetical protein [Muribaculaceae bacterium]MDE6534343.1 hypothetical protein [Muribaculaceae bacterium]MDE6771625.1 hypothetical protein [Muribaculaceae bacterium]